MLKDVNNVVRVPSSIEEGTFFYYWLKFLTPFHKLSEKEIVVGAVLLKQYFLLSKKILDEELLNAALLSESSRKAICKECNAHLDQLHVIFSSYRKKGFFKGNAINPKFIPNLVEDKNNFKLLLLFDFSKKNEENI
jgi:hypothetical protein